MNNSADTLWQECQTYFEGDEKLTKLWVEKYALRNQNATLEGETPDSRLQQIASAIAQVEQRYPNALSQTEIDALLRNFRKLILSGKCLVGVANDNRHAPLSGSYVLSHPSQSHSYGTLMKADEEQVQLMKRCCGVAHRLIPLVDNDGYETTSAAEKSAILPSLERFAISAAAMTSGRKRNGLGLSIDACHPEMVRMIQANNASPLLLATDTTVMLDDSVLESLGTNKRYQPAYTIYTDGKRQGDKLSAQALIDEIAKQITTDGTPRVHFTGNYQRQSIAQSYEERPDDTTVVPGSGFALMPYEGVKQAAINLYAYIQDPFTPKARWDEVSFKRDVQYSVRILDDLVDIEIDKINSLLATLNTDGDIPEWKCCEQNLWIKIRNKTQETRRIALSLIGLADSLAALGLPYSSDEALDMTEKIYRSMALAAYEASVNLAEERGSFGCYRYEQEHTHPFYKQLKKANSALVKKMKSVGRRNISLLGTTVLGAATTFAQTTLAIEPLRNVAYRNRRKLSSGEDASLATFTDENGEAYVDSIQWHPAFLQWLKNSEISYLDTVPDDETIAQWVEQSPYRQSLLRQIQPMSKLQLLARAQRWSDQVVNSTLQVPSDTEYRYIAKLLVEAWQQGCVSISVYRENSGSGKMQDVSQTSVCLQPWKHIIHRNLSPIPEATEIRPKILDCDVVRFQNNKEKWVALVGLLDGHPYEIFTGLQDDDEGIVLPKMVTKGRIIKNHNEDGTSRYDFQFENKRGYKTTVEGLNEKFNPEYWNYAKLISGVLRYRMPIDRVIKLVGSLQLSNESINTWKVGVERALKKYVVEDNPDGRTRCELCGQDALVMQEGVLVCQHCGAARCR